MNNETKFTTGRQLLNEVTGKFRIQGTTLAHWARENGILYQNTVR